MFSCLTTEQKNELWASLVLLHVAGLGAAKRKKLVDFFGSAQAAVQQAQRWGAARAGVKEASFEHFTRGTWRTEAEAAWKNIQSVSFGRSAQSGRAGLANPGDPAGQAGVLLYTDPAYPQILKEIPDAPLLLFYLGDPGLLHNTAVGIVGARKCSKEGALVAENIARGLTQAGITCVSGLARGIDRTVHLAGLSGVGSSIAVLGCGVDVLYPTDNRDLYERMCMHGLILSEFFPGTPPLAHNFPVRNRIISGLSKAVLVVEAAARSGTLITARHALEQNRDVYAVPGSTLASTSEGCRELIRRGAKPVFSAEDVLLDLTPILGAELQEKLDYINNSTLVPEPGILPWTNQSKHGMDSKPEQGLISTETPISVDSTPSEAVVALTSDETMVATFIRGKERCHVDELAAGLAIQVSRLSATLSMLEIKGVLRRLPGMYYSLQN
ncbi:MAG: DNA-processing protein DprA [Deltaproteobacteria bacterium]|nr:DNA-processing protein DprA [Deltaproteobacteria bacterium]